MVIDLGLQTHKGMIYFHCATHPTHGHDYWRPSCPHTVLHMDQLVGLIANDISNVSEKWFYRHRIITIISVYIKSRVGEWAHKASCSVVVGSIIKLNLSGLNCGSV